MAKQTKKYDRVTKATKASRYRQVIAEEPPVEKKAAKKKTIKQKLKELAE